MTPRASGTPTRRPPALRGRHAFIAVSGGLVYAFLVMVGVPTPVTDFSARLIPAAVMAVAGALALYGAQRFTVRWRPYGWYWGVTALAMSLVLVSFFAMVLPLLVFTVCIAGAATCLGFYVDAYQSYR